MKIQWKIVCFLLISGSVFAGEVQTVNNGKTVSGKTETLEFVEDLVIGPETEEDHLIWASFLTTVDADSKGNMFVCDPGENRVVEFDSEGKFVRSIGRKGEGPGEFLNLKSFQVLDNGTAIAFEQAQILTTLNYYDKALDYRDKKVHQSFELIPTTALFSRNGEWISSTVASVNMTTQMTAIHYAILNQDLEIKKDLIVYETPNFNPQRLMESEYWSEYLAGNMKQTSKGLLAFVAFGKDGSVYTAKADRYEIQKLDSKLNPVQVIKKAYDPIPMTKEQIDAMVEPISERILGNLPAQLQSVVTEKTIAKAVKMAEFPPVHFPISHLLALENGYLLVLHEVDMVKDIAKVDIFNPAGVYVGSCEHGFNSLTKMVFKNGYAYTIENRDDDNTLVRYKINIK
ncbi:MAG: hypothetical protein CR997_03850 [Acidobacteria bacterium]|nr:MAG: hypothetical protein CR997_03850 [Acidobacteriota bacterium]